MARKAPAKETLRDLGIRSGNECAFPGCNHPILNENGEYIAQLCHIEAANPGGPRYNNDQDDEQRRSIENLMFLCYRHHKETDDIVKYPVERLIQIKADHEAGQVQKINIELLIEQVEAVAKEQSRIIHMLEDGVADSSQLGSFKIVGPMLRGAWTPEDGRFYEFEYETGKYKFVMKDGWLHVEQTLKDGSVQYFEVNEAGSVRNSHMPYPINEYRVVIPEHLILSRQRVESQIGTHAFLTTLKWSMGTVTEHFLGEHFAGADVKARCHIEHSKKTISVLDTNDV